MAVLYLLCGQPAGEDAYKTAQVGFHTASLAKAWTVNHGTEDKDGEGLTTDVEGGPA